jgi:hypothetical protein
MYYHMYVKGVTSADTNFKLKMFRVICTNLASIQVHFYIHILCVTMSCYAHS